MTPLIHNRNSFFDLRPEDRVLIGDMHYVVEKHVQGGMGCVCMLWKDLDKSPRKMSALGLKLALKAVLPDATCVEGASLFRRELTVWSGFRHFNIIWLLEIIDGGNAGWLAAMDWCPWSLRDLLKKERRLSIEDSSFIISSILEGLAYAYGKDQVIHLDLKPENILIHLDPSKLMEITESHINNKSLNHYRFMVSDWGIASVKQLALNRVASLPLSSNSAQKTFNNVGTLLYMSPERFKEGFSSSLKSDIFSLGMIYSELLTGKLPFVNGAHPILSLITGQYIDELNRQLDSKYIPKKVKELILGMVAYNPRERISDYNVLRKELLKAAGKSLGIIAKIFGK